MMKKTKLTGAVLATAVALAFTTATAKAADQPNPSSQVKCVGGNACKGQSACKTASSSCQGQNSCKGKGWVMSASADECSKAGGQAEKPSKGDMM